ncbi:MAG: DUF3568 family protein [Nitrospira sp.]|nr:DUF3568 family protein [bacterium]MBL7048683.1 DUF3568 family protein [Nitrospira sp.]
MKGLKRLIIILAAVSMCYGCAAALIGVGAGMGIGAYKYIDGQLSREYPVEMPKAWDAANNALSNLQISITDSLNDVDKATIEAVRRDGSKVSIMLKDRGQGVTTIIVRVGVLGDRDEATRIHDEIASNAGIR